MKQTKLSYFALLSSLMLTVVACGDAKNTGEVQESDSSFTLDAEVKALIEGRKNNDAAIYENVLGDYAALSAAAKTIKDDSERFVKYAEAEAALLASGVMSPYSTQGGAYTISRVAPRTIPYVMYGNDDDRWHGLVIADKFITKADREALLAEWNAAVKGEGTYDPAATLAKKGYSINHDYKTTFSTAPVTLDTLNTSEQSDTEVLVQTIEGLVENNNLGQLKGAMAQDWSVSEDGKTYTFNIRKGCYWYNANGTQYAEVKADDFVAGFQHMLDCKAGLEWLVEGVIKGVTEYDAGTGDWADVGYKVDPQDPYKLVIELEQATSYFVTMLTYSCFMPMNRAFYQSKGGVFGGAALDAAKETDNYTYGKTSDLNSMVYNGPYVPEKFAENEIKLTKNANYYKAADVTLDSITWIKDGGENPTQTYNDVISGVYAGTGLSESTGTLKLAKEATYEKVNLFDNYAYISDTTSTSYLMGLNLNRGTVALASGACASKNANNKAKLEYTNKAMQNRNFRLALQHAFDRASVNAVSRGEDLKTTNLRNMYTAPNFVQLAHDVTIGTGDTAHTFVAGTMYGDLVQYFVDKLGLKVNVADGQDGWYNAAEAQKYFGLAKTELNLTDAVEIDVVYYSASKAQVGQANAFKKVIEDTLGATNVQVNLVEATTTADFYACGYRASTGAAGNFDVFYGSGWGPDFGDPCSYLDTFLGAGAGYMTKIIGLF